MFTKSPQCLDSFEDALESMRNYRAWRVRLEKDGLVIEFWAYPSAFNNVYLRKCEVLELRDCRECTSVTLNYMLDRVPGYLDAGFLICRSPGVLEAPSNADFSWSESVMIPTKYRGHPPVAPFPSAIRRPRVPSSKASYRSKRAPRKKKKVDNSSQITIEEHGLASIAAKRKKNSDW